MLDKRYRMNHGMLRGARQALLELGLNPDLWESESSFNVVMVLEERRIARGVSRGRKVRTP